MEFCHAFQIVRNQRQLTVFHGNGIKKQLSVTYFPPIWYSLEYVLLWDFLPPILDFWPVLLLL